MSPTTRLAELKQMKGDVDPDPNPGSDVESGKGVKRKERDDNAASKTGETLMQELEDRSISKNIIQKFTQVGVTTLPELRKLPFDTLKEYFNTDCKSSFIDWKHIKALWSGDTISTDYIPPIRKQCIKHGIDLKYADTFEKLNVSNLKHVTESKLQEAMISQMKTAKQQKNPENTETSETEVKKDTPDDEIKSSINDIRSAVGIVKSEDETDDDDDEKVEEKGKGADDEDAKKQALKEAQEQNQAMAKKSLDDANAMRDNVNKVLDSMDPQKLVGESADDLAKKLESLKALVKPPSDIDDVGKKFLSNQDLMAKMSTKAMFDASAGYLKPYNSDKDLFAAASGGLALTGIGVFTDKHDTLVGCTLPILAPPDHVSTLGVFTPFHSDILQTTSQSQAAAFQSRATSVGMSMAKSMHQSVSASVSVSSPFASGSASAGEASSSNMQASSKSDSNTSAHTNTKTQTAQLTESIMMPMRTFRIPASAMKLSDDAILELRNATTPTKAKAFLNQFGSHVSRGRHTLGGVFFRNISLTSDEAMSSNKMFASAGTQLSKSSKSSKEASVSVGASDGIISGSASISASSSMSGGSSCGTMSVGSDDSSTASTQCTYSFHTTCMGPNATTPEDFAKLLQSNNATWACIDRGDPTSLYPIWEIIENDSRPINLDGSSSNASIAGLIKATWLQSLKPWVRGEWLANPSVKNILDSYHSVEGSYKELSTLIFEYVRITYADSSKMISLKQSVKIAINALADDPGSLVFNNSNWIYAFIALGDGDKTILNSLQESRMVNCQMLAYSIAQNFSSNDWSFYNDSFVEYAARHWKLQLEVQKNLPQDGVVTIIPSSNTNVCVDGGNTKSQAYVWKRNYTNAQKFKVQHTSDGYFNLSIVGAANQFIDVASVGKQSHIHSADSDTAKNNQKWVAYKSLKNVGSDFMLLPKVNTNYAMFVADPCIQSSAVETSASTSTQFSFELQFNLSKDDETKCNALSAPIIECLKIAYSDSSKLASLQNVVKASAGVMAKNKNRLYTNIFSWINDFLDLSNLDVSALKTSGNTDYHKKAYNAAKTFTADNWKAFSFTFTKYSNTYLVNQRKLIQLGPSDQQSVYIIPSKDNKMCVTTSGGDDSSGTLFELCSNSKNQDSSQYFYVKHTDDGCITFGPKCAIGFLDNIPSLWLDVNGVGKQCHLWENDSKLAESNQTWVLYQDPNNFGADKPYMILLKSDTRYCMNVSSSSKLTTSMNGTSTLFTFDS